MSRGMPRLPYLAAATVLAVLTFAPGAGAADRPSTPDLIEQAARDGRVDAGQATVLRAQALAGTVPAEYRSDAPWEGTPVALEVSEGREHGGGGEIRQARHTPAHRPRLRINESAGRQPTLTAAAVSDATPG